MLFENEAAVGIELRSTSSLLKVHKPTTSEIILKSDALNLGNASVLAHLLSELDTHTHTHTHT